MTDRPFNPWLYEFYRRYSPRIETATELRVVFLIGSADISGGTYVIFEHATRMKRAGMQVVVVPLFDMSTVAADWHPALAELEFATLPEVASRDFDVAIATWWPTVYELPNVRFRHAIYFVQSAESRFYAIGPDRDAAASAELTYTFGLPGITIATWLQMYLGFHHNMMTFLCRNGVDRTRYGLDGPVLAPRPPSGLRVLVEGSMAPMKGVQQAVDAAVEGGADEVWLLTPSDVTSFSGCTRVLSRIPAERTAEVYRSCDVLVKLSQVEGMYGPPLEMFHCGGTAVTNDVTGSDEYVRDDVNALVVPTGDVAAAARAVARLKGDPELLNRLKFGAAQTASRWHDWDEAGEEFIRIVCGIAAQPPVNRGELVSRIRGSRGMYDDLVADR